jgi:anti-sigma B factor antagonist
MKLQNTGNTLRVSQLKELTASNAASVRDSIKEGLQAGHQNLDMDLSETTFIDSSGLGVLISLQKTLRARSGVIRIVRPTPAVIQVLELTRMHRIFDLVRD